MDGEAESTRAVERAEEAEHSKPKRGQPREVEQTEPLPLNVEATPRPDHHILQAEEHRVEVPLLRGEALRLQGELLLQEAGAIC